MIYIHKRDKPIAKHNYGYLYVEVNLQLMLFLPTIDKPTANHIYSFLYQREVNTQPNIA